MTLTNLFLTIAISLDFEVVEPAVESITNTIIKQEFEIENQLEENIELTRQYCNNNSEYVLEQNIADINISCDILEMEIDQIINKTVREKTKEIYYTDYDCDFWDCLEKTGSPFFLISLKAQDYWYSKFFMMLFISLALIFILFLTIKNISNFTIITGIIFILSSAIFAKLDYIINKITQAIITDSSEIMTQSSEIIKQVFYIFFAQASQVYLTIILIGIIFIALGIIIKFFGLGMKFNLFLEKLGKHPEKGKEAENGKNKKD